MTLIHDGYTVDGAVTAEGWTLRLLYRPMLSEERWQFRSLARSWSEAGHLRLIAPWMDRHIVETDLCDTYRLELDTLFLESPQMFKRLMQVLMGVRGPDDHPNWDSNWEHNDWKNLQEGLQLRLQYPGLHRRKCSDCQKFWYDEKSDKPFRTNEGRAILRTVDTPLACTSNDGCPVGTPEKQKRLSLKNRRALAHFQMCDAIGQFPDDPIVARNALVIRRVLSQFGVPHGRQRPDAERHAGRGNGDVAPTARPASHSRASPAAVDASFFFAGRNHWDD